MKKIFLIILILFIGVVSLHSQNADIISSTVEFIVNTDEFVQNEKYNHFLNTTVPFINENQDQIENILLIGSSSPEGDSHWNRHLERKRSDKVHSYFNTILRQKVNIVNDYGFFLEKTGYDDSNWRRLRATYIEIQLKKSPEYLIDTIYIKESFKDTIYVNNTVTDTVYMKPELIPILALKTNLAGDLLMTPNVQVELYTHLWGLSLEFDYSFPWWSKDYDTYFYYMLLNGKTGIRKYLNNRYTGHWIGIYANTAIYDTCLFNKNEGWQGELYGAGLGYGYVFQNRKHPRVKFEPYIRVGWFNTKFDKYHASQPWDERYYYNWYKRASEFTPRRFSMNYFGPTEIGFNFTFDLICSRKY